MTSIIDIISKLFLVRFFQSYSYEVARCRDNNNNSQMHEEQIDTALHDGITKKLNLRIIPSQYLFIKTMCKLFLRDKGIVVERVD